MSQANSLAGDNTIDPFSTQRARTTVAVCAVFMFIAALAIVARFWSRYLKGKQPALDDWLILGGLIFYYFSAVQTILQVRLGRLGHHLDDGITQNELILNGKLGTFGQYAYALTMGFIRWSICSLLYQIFITKSFRRAILACNIINILWILFSIFIVSFRCIPYSKNWDTTKPGTCLAQVPIVAAIAAWGLAIELTIWTLPIPAVWKLQMPRSSKVALTLIFGLGIFDIGIGIGRLVTVLQVKESDFTWSEVPALDLLAVEPSIAIVVACMCVCRPLMEKILPKKWRKSSGSGRSGDDSIKLVSKRNPRNPTGVGSSSGAFSDANSQPEPEDLQDGVVHVRRDVIVSADSEV